MSGFAINFDLRDDTRFRVLAKTSRRFSQVHELKLKCCCNHSSCFFVSSYGVSVFAILTWQSCTSSPAPQEKKATKLTKRTRLHPCRQRSPILFSCVRPTFLHFTLLIARVYIHILSLSLSRSPPLPLSVFWAIKSAGASHRTVPPPLTASEPHGFAKSGFATLKMGLSKVDSSP